MKNYDGGGHGFTNTFLQKTFLAVSSVRVRVLRGRAFVCLAVCAMAALSAQTPLRQATVGQAAFDLGDASIADLQRRMASGQDTARSLVEKYLARIEAIDRQGPALHSVLETNPDALAIADRLDAERKSKGPRGPLHGIPILIKDNIATADRMTTSAGSLALVGSHPPKDAFIVERLREAGAVILGKTNLSEWANFRSTHGSSGWSGRGGQTKNPYALDRNPSGSSSGSGAAAAASLAAAGNGRIDRVAVERQLAGRHQADPRPLESHRNRADCPQSRHGRTHGADSG